MHLYSFKNDLEHADGLSEGIVINGYTSALWIERYATADEFEIIAPLSSGLRYTLALGTYISHTDSERVMVVENQSIQDNSDGVTEITISGRGIESLLEQRAVGSIAALAGNTLTPYVMSANHVHIQVRDLIKYHACDLAHEHFRFGELNCITLGTFTTQQNTYARTAKNGELYSEVLRLLEPSALGLGSRKPTGGWPTVLVIHEGQDVSADVAFVYGRGEIENAEYLWSNKTLKNSAVVEGSLIIADYFTGYQQQERRVMYIKSDADADTSLTTDAQRNTALEAVAADALAGQNAVALVSAGAARNNTRYRYRTDYEIGDIVGVEGNYDTATKMRVTEHVEIVDATGKFAYPTLANLNE